MRLSRDYLQSLGRKPRTAILKRRTDGLILIWYFDIESFNAAILKLGERLKPAYELAVKFSLFIRDQLNEDE